MALKNLTVTNATQTMEGNSFMLSEVGDDGAIIPGGPVILLQFPKDCLKSFPFEFGERYNVDFTPFFPELKAS